MNLAAEKVQQLLNSAKEKMYGARLKRQAPYVDKTVYVGWNSLCVSAYLEAARVLNLPDARRFALRSLDRVIAQAHHTHESSSSLLHVLAYSDPDAEHREVPGMLEDYAFTALACLDAYETTADLSYFRFAQSIVDSMVTRFFDVTGGGFFDSEPDPNGKNLGVLATRRKPLQDSPTPAGNPMAAIALLRLHHLTGQADYRAKAEQTLETFAAVAEQFGIFAATYGTATLHFLESPIQVVIIQGEDEATANQLYANAVAPFAFSKAVIRLKQNQAVPENLPPALANTIPQLPALREGRSCAVLCSGSTCQAPVFSANEVRKQLRAMEQ